MIVSSPSEIVASGKEHFDAGRGTDIAHTHNAVVYQQLKATQSGFSTLRHATATS